MSEFALSSRRWLLACTALTLAVPPSGAAQIAKSPPPAGARTHTVIPGERYRAGGMKRWLLGSDYRDLWTAPVDAAVLDLDSVGGGLTPLRTGGFGQSVSLHFRGRDGRRYVVRSIDKDPTKRLLPELKNTFVEDIVQDQISALHPTAALVVDPLLEATGILHAKHTLVVIPDDPRLGEYRTEFAGMLGMLVLHPDEGADNTPGFAGSRRISGSDEFFGRLEDGPCDRVDARAFLKARLMDMVIGDRDRHAGQWRWASFPDSTCRIWLPIPEDRDQAFVDYDGLVMWITRRSRPQQITFGPRYPNVTGLTFNAWELDRELLVELDGTVWDSMATAIQSQLPDEVIEQAVRRLPAEHFRLSGQGLMAALKGRRDALPRLANQYYRLISRWAEIKATDEDEYVELEHLPNGDLDVRIGLADGGDRPYFRRVFHREVTKEVRLYLRGGDDRAEVLGQPGRMLVRIDGGGGDDTLVNSSQAGSNETRFYDAGGDTRFVPGRGAKVDQRPYERPPAKDQAHKHALDWGGRGLSYPLMGYSPDPGLFVAATIHLERYGYRKHPYKTRHTFLAGLVSNGPEPLVSYTGRFRGLWSGIDGQLHLAYTGLTFLRFNGLGNETDIPGSNSFYEIEQRDLVVAPSLQFRVGTNRGGAPNSGTEPLRQSLTLGIGPVLKYSDIPLDDNATRFIATVDPAPYGAESFGQLGAQVALEIDMRDNAGQAQRGLHVVAGASFYPKLWDVESTFGEVHGAASVYLTAAIPTQPTLALRAGGKKVWGPFPFFEAAYIGGGQTLRGYRSQRFGGDAAVFGNAELRFTVAPFKVLVPGTVGLFGLADVGRVFHESDPADADTWHTGLGGGIWFSFVNRMQTLTLAIANGDDLTGVYLQAGFMY